MNELWLNDSQENEICNLKIPEEKKDLYFKDNPPLSDFEKPKEDNNGTEKKNDLKNTETNNLDHIVDQVIDGYEGIKKHEN